MTFSLSIDMSHIIPPLKLTRETNFSQTTIPETNYGRYELHLIFIIKWFILLGFTWFCRVWVTRFWDARFCQIFSSKSRITRFCHLPFTWIQSSKRVQYEQRMCTGSCLVDFLASTIWPKKTRLLGFFQTTAEFVDTSKLTFRAVLRATQKNVAG